jgi:peptidyl-prolyl cis-trans isomerase SurA
MRLKAYAAGIALAALLASPLAAQEETAGVGAGELQSAQPLSESVVAVVNDEIISSYDLRQRLLLTIAMSGLKVNEKNLPALQQQALRTLVDEHLQFQEMKRLDFKIGDDEVDAEIASMAKQNNMTKEQLFEGLRSVGVDPETFRTQIKAQVSWNYLVGARYRDRAKVGADQIEQTLARQSAAATKPQYLIGEIYIDAAAVGGMNEALAGANQLVDQMIKGAPFPSVARQFSNAPSAPSGGDAGWMIAGEMPAEVENAVSQMQPGQLSKPIPTKDGVWIVYLREARSGGGATVVNLKQAAVRLAADASPEQVAAAQAKLSGLQGKVTCENIEDVAGKVDGVVASDLGETSITELTPAFRDLAQTLNAGQVSQPVRTDVGLHVVAVCGKKVVGADVLTRDEVEQRLFVQQLTMLGRRWMRDLRNSATIEMR